MTVAVLGNKPDSICFPLGNGVTGDLPSLEGHTALLDGGAQKLYVDPTPDILSRLGPPDPSIRLSTPNQL